MPHNRFEYAVCMCQDGRVTFVNHQWAGTREMNPSDVAGSLGSCSMVHDYLNAVGGEGWELVAVTQQQAAGGTHTVTLYLKRALA